MKVMTLHEWYGKDIENVHWDGRVDVRRIGLKSGNRGWLLVNKEDAIALAKEFDLAVYPKDAEL